MKICSSHLLIDGWRNYINEGNWGVAPSVDKIFSKIKILEELYREREIEDKVVIKYFFSEDEYSEVGFGNDPPLRIDIDGRRNFVFLEGDIHFDKTDVDWVDGYAWGGFRVIETHDVTKGFGPLLYEILIEKATEAGTFLMSDRHNVSDDALRVWNVYLQRNDVEKVQLDINDRESRDWEIKQLTPNNSLDDTSMDAAVDDKGKENWFESSLSKGYYKKNKSTPVLDYLRNSEYISFIEN